MAYYPANLKAAELIEKVQTGKYRIVQTNGCRGFQLAYLRGGTWCVGAGLNTMAARAACKRLVEVPGIHLTFWHGA